MDQIRFKMTSTIHQKEPWNAEPILSRLLDYEITPLSLQYSRNHSNIPSTESLTDCVTFHSLENQILKIDHERLRTLEQTELEVAIQCAGLRRDEMSRKLGETEGVQWSSGAVSNCIYRGVLLTKLLDFFDEKLSSGPVDRKTGHVEFNSHASACQEDDYYHVSVPLALALEKECLVALECNGIALTAKHGGPVRIILPGCYGVRSTKWLDTIKLLPNESNGFYQKRDYKILPANIISQDQAKSEGEWEKNDAMIEVSVESVVEQFGENGKTVRGYALSSSQICKVDVCYNLILATDDKQESGDWEPATIEYSGGPHGWSIFTHDIPEYVKTGSRVYSRATDSQGHVQKGHQNWNLRGVGMSSYGEAVLKF